MFGAWYKFSANEMAKARLVRGKPGAHLRIRFRRRAIVHGFEIFSDAQVLPHGMAVEGRIAASDMVLKLAFDISQQA